MPRPENIDLPAFSQPRVTIVIPVHGQCAFTLRCLQSIARASGATPFEVIVVDDASPDDTVRQLAQVTGLRVHALATNVGYLHAVNAGAALANSRYLCLLNNDVEVQPGWLDALITPLDADPTIGLVGARLVDMAGGTLLEAGGVVFRDGNAANYGRGEPAAGAAYLHPRDVDYCSAAAVVVRTDLWRTLGGFDERYAPAYYEDTDLAFATRALGYRVRYQPAAIVEHAEGSSHGTEVSTGVKAFQLRNRERFVDKWRSELSAQHLDARGLLRARDRGCGPRVVIIDAQTPTPDSDSGSVRMWGMLDSLRRVGARITLVPTDGRPRPPWTDRLRDAGIEVLDGQSQLDRVLAGLEPELVLISRVDTATKALLEVRRHAPSSLLVFDTVDLHHLRLSRRAVLDGDLRSRELARSYEQLELALVRSCDVTLTVSQTERQALLAAAPGSDIRVLSNVHTVAGLGPDFAARQGVLFVGNYHHPPNIDAAIFLAREVMPLVREQLPGLPLVLAGNDPTPTVRGLADPHTSVPGWLPELTDLYAQARVGVAPLRYGAGVKGKVGEAMGSGLPMVLTPAAAEGMALVDGTHTLLGSSAEEFAAAVVRLHRDRALWCRLVMHGRAHVGTVFSPQLLDLVLRGLLDLVGQRRALSGELGGALSGALA